MSKKKKGHLVLVDGSLVAQRDTKLTAKQSCFIRELVSKDADAKPQSLSQAYRNCYDTKNMSPQTIWTKASLLANQDKVRSRVKALEAQADAKSLRSAHSRLEFVISQLELEALGKGADSNSASRVRALELLGKLAHGGGSLFQERIATEDNRDSETLQHELEQRLSRLLAGNSAE
tara:strand:+ start:802 stop:1329 length:528 start_codon:yes stop_codon:yes gene_type:complete